MVIITKYCKCIQKMLAASSQVFFLGSVVTLSLTCLLPNHSAFTHDFRNLIYPSTIPAYDQQPPVHPSQSCPRFHSFYSWDRIPMFHTSSNYVGMKTLMTRRLFRAVLFDPTLLTHTPYNFEKLAPLIAFCFYSHL